MIPPATVPPMIARLVHISIKPLPEESFSWGRISGRMPYLDGLKRAACTPRSPRIKSAGKPPAGLSKSTAVPSSMSTSSSAFIARSTLRLLNRSARAPPGRLKMISGISRITWANAALSCESVALAAEAIASSTTICFHALSLNAPRACEINRPTSGCLPGGDPLVICLSASTARSPETPEQSPDTRAHRCEQKASTIPSGRSSDSQSVSSAPRGRKRQSLHPALTPRSPCYLTQARGDTSWYPGSSEAHLMVMTRWRIPVPGRAHELSNWRGDNPETLSRWLIDEAGGGGGEMLAIGWAAPLEFQ